MTAILQEICQGGVKLAEKKTTKFLFSEVKSSRVCIPYMNISHCLDAQQALAFRRQITQSYMIIALIMASALHHLVVFIEFA